MERNDSLIASLEPPSEWEPNPAIAFSRLQGRQSAHRKWKQRSVLAAAGAATVLVALIAVPLQTVCAQCVRPLPKTTAPPAPPALAVAVVEKPVVAPATPIKMRPVTPSVAAIVNFKQSGSPTAPIACEIYTDYECPACAELYNQTMPAFIEAYVRTGKVRLLHRDMPLPQHRFARLAARYANAAGSAGFYEVAVQQIFRTQNVWKQDGTVDRQLAMVLPADAMEKVRHLVESADPALDQTVAADVSESARDRINQTPTIVVVSNGKRTPLAGYVTFPVLKSYLDQLFEK